VGETKEMNITESEEPLRIIAKTCGCKQEEKKVGYSFIDVYHFLCLDKKDIILAQSEACERLLAQTSDGTDRKIIEDEIAELKMA
jgi:hypothetical protein